MAIIKNHNNRGFSLVGVLTGVAVLSIVLIASAYVVVQTKAVEVRFDLQAEMDRSHLLSLQKSRSVSYLRRHLSLNLDQSRNLRNNPPNTALLSCLGRAGTNCTTTNAFARSFADVPEASGKSGCNQGAGCSIDSNVQYKVNCSSPTACESLDVQFITAHSVGGSQSSPGGGGDRPGQSFKERKNLIKMPGALFASRGNIAFDCTNSRVLTGIDFDTLQAICPDAAAKACANNAPLQGYGNAGGPANCPTLVSQNCAGNAGGLRSVGMYNNQAACRL